MLCVLHLLRNRCEQKRVDLFAVALQWHCTRQHAFTWLWVMDTKSDNGFDMQISKDRRTESTRASMKSTLEDRRGSGHEDNHEDNNSCRLTVWIFQRDLVQPQILQGRLLRIPTGNAKVVGDDQRAWTRLHPFNANKKASTSDRRTNVRERTNMNKRVR